jgi:hypothetical protein
MGCPKGMAWDSAKKKCVRVAPGQSIANPLSLLGIGKKEYSLKGGVDWFGEDSISSQGMRRKATKPVKNARSPLSSRAKKLMNQKKGGSVTKWTRRNKNYPK